MNKKIEIVYLKPSSLNHNFGNPRKITQYKFDKLKESLKKIGDHDIIKINEKLEIISGNQRVKAMIELNIDIPVLCKKFIGYSEKELKKINIDSNEHLGEWDYELKEKWEKEFEKDYNNKEIKIPKKIEIKPYKKIHILLSIDINKINEVLEILKQLYNKKGIEIEQSQN